MNDKQLSELISAAKEMLQNDLDNHGYGNVEDWGSEMEEQLGWGETCAAYRLGRILKEIRIEEKQKDFEINNEMPPYDSRDIYLTKDGEIIGLHEVGEANSSWTVEYMDGREEIKYGFNAIERWGNEYNNDLEMIGRGSFRVFQDIEELAKEFETDGWTRFIPEKI